MRDARDVEKFSVEHHRQRDRRQERGDRAEEPGPQLIQVLGEGHSAFGIDSAGTGAAFAEALAVDEVSPSLSPFLNSLKPDPTERMSWGIFWAPKSSRTITTTRSTWVPLRVA